MFLDWPWGLNLRATAGLKNWPQDGLRSACVSVGVIACTVPFLNVQALQPTEYDPQLCQGPGVWVWAIHWTA